MSDPSKKKGTPAGSITIFFNDKFRPSHVTVEGKGDLVSRRVIQDSLMLVNRAVTKSRLSRKASGVVGKKELARVEALETDRLGIHKRKKQYEKAYADAQLENSLFDREKAAQVALEKRRIIRIQPGYVPAKKVEPEVKKSSNAQIKKDLVAKKLVTKKPETVIKENDNGIV